MKIIKDKKYNYTYKITNKINNKYYYGCHSTDNLEDGYMGSSIILNRSIEKHGIENFEMDWIENFSSRKEMFKHEKELITEEMIKDKQCYNLKPGGEGRAWPKGKRPSLASIEKNRQTHLLLKYRHTDEAKEKISQAGIGRPCSEETRKKISESNIGRIISQESRDKASKTLKGRKQTEETKKRMSEGQKRREPFSQEIRDKMRMSQIGKKHTDEAKNNMALSKIGTKRDRQVKRNISINLAKRKGWFLRTPFGDFISFRSCCKYTGLKHSFLLKFFTNIDEKFLGLNNDRFPLNLLNMKGKTPRSVGFDKIDFLENVDYNLYFDDKFKNISNSII